MIDTWTTATFRAGRRFELKRFDELTPSQQEPLRELQQEEDFYGVLLPSVPGSANVRSVGRDAAVLLRSLATPSHLDPALIDARDIADFVLDGVLEIEDCGDFVCGADAFRLVCDKPGSQPSGLSVDALQYAEDLMTDDVVTLTTALYLYNRIPMSRFWKARFPDRDAVLDHVGAKSPPLASILQARWQMLSPDQSQGWIAWHSREPVRPQDGVTYKLYVGARPEEIREVFAAVVRVLAAAGAPDFKIGQDASGLLRADKLVIYFATRTALDEAARELRIALAGCRAHGVPFTARVGGDELLSWGLDPPDSARPLSWLSRESWRLWLATQLGTAMAYAKTSSRRKTVESWRFALERVRRMGVDVERWTPAETLWRSV